MKTSFFRMMKRWWLIALVFTLALSLTSCSKRQAINQDGASDYGWAACDSDEFGQIDVYVIPNYTTGQYELYVIPVQLVEPGDVVEVHVANESSQGFRPVIAQTTLNNEVENTALLTYADLYNYDSVAIVSFPLTGEEANTPLFQRTYRAPGETEGQKGVLCDLPLPGNTALDNVGNPPAS